MVIQEKTYGTDVEAVVAEIMVKFQAGYNTLKNEEQVLSYKNQMIAWNLDLAAIPRAPATATQACTMVDGVWVPVEVRSDPEVSHKLSDAQMWAYLKQRI